jgi:hypothetical protein
MPMQTARGFFASSRECIVVLSNDARRVRRAAASTLP